MVRLATSPSHTACFPIKSLYLTGTRAQGQVQTDICLKLFLAIISHRSSPFATPPLHSSPHFGLLFVVVCFQLNLPLWTANGQKWAGGSERGGFRVGGEGLAPGTAVTEEKSRTSQGFLIQYKAGFSLWTGSSFYTQGPWTAASSQWRLHQDHHSVAFIP